MFVEGTCRINDQLCILSLQTMMYLAIRLGSGYMFLSIPAGRLYNFAFTLLSFKILYLRVFYIPLEVTQQSLYYVKIIVVILIFACLVISFYVTCNSSE